MDPQEPGSVKQQEEEQSVEASESQDPPLKTGEDEDNKGKGEPPPTTSDDNEDQQQKVAENPPESSTEVAKPPSKPKEILVIPTVPVHAPKVLCVPFSGSDEDSPVSPVTSYEDSKTTPSMEKVKKSTIIVIKG